MANIFDLRLSCWCFNGETCICGDEEKVLRHYAAGQPLPAMTTAQREWCINETASSEEGAVGRHDLEGLTDRELADATIRGWKNYAVSQGMY